MGPLDPADGVTDPGRDRRARPLGGVPQPPAPAAEAGGAGELVDERVAFGRQPGRSLDVVVCVRLRQLVVEVGQPGAVLGPGPVVEDRVGAEARQRLAARRDPATSSAAATSRPGAASRTARSRRPFASRSCARGRRRRGSRPRRRGGTRCGSRSLRPAWSRADGRRSSSARARSPCSRAPRRSDRAAASSRCRAASSQRPSAAASRPSCRATGPVVKTAAPTTANSSAIGSSCSYSAAHRRTVRHGRGQLGLGRQHRGVPPAVASREDGRRGHQGRRPVPVTRLDEQP